MLQNNDELIHFLIDDCEPIIKLLLSKYILCTTKNENDDIELANFFQKIIINCKRGSTIWPNKTKMNKYNINWNVNYFDYWYQYIIPIKRTLKERSYVEMENFSVDYRQLVKRISVIKSVIDNLYNQLANTE